MNETSPVKVGIVGAGNISATYVATLHMFDFIRVKSIHDLYDEPARRLASQFGLQAASLDGMLSDAEIGLIINLTIPTSHFAISKKALLAGKHVYSEKPLGISMEEADELMSIARASDLRLGCAPDTFLGGGHQLTRRLYDEGRIGKAISATAMLLLPGHEHWHPNPAFFYGRGGGPMLDVGPYYVTNLIALLGPVREVFGAAKITRIERQVKTDPRRGETIKVLVPTHLTGVMEFHCGATVTIATSFDVIRHKHNQIEIYGLEGTMVTPDPNNFTGKVELFRDGDAEWQDVPVNHPYVEGVPGHLGLRGLGAAEMVDSLRAGRPHRMSSELAFHALEVMTAFERSAQSRKVVAIGSSCGRPDPIPPTVRQGHFT
jgi:predicted dehydrogenase